MATLSGNEAVTGERPVYNENIDDLRREEYPMLNGKVTAPAMCNARID